MPRQAKVEWAPTVNLAVKIPATLHREIIMRTAQEQMLIRDWVVRALRQSLARRVGGGGAR